MTRGTREKESARATAQVVPPGQIKPGPQPAAPIPATQAFEDPACSDAELDGLVAILPFASQGEMNGRQHSVVQHDLISATISRTWIRLLQCATKSPPNVLKCWSLPLL